MSPLALARHARAHMRTYYITIQRGGREGGGVERFVTRWSHTVNGSSHTVEGCTSLLTVDMMALLRDTRWWERPMPVSTASSW